MEASLADGCRLNKMATVAVYVKLAEELIQLSGYRPYEDIEIAFTGLRPGEKLYEELLLAGEGVQPTCHEKIMVARAAEGDEAVLVRQIEELYLLARAVDLAGVVAKLQEMVPEFQPTRPGRGKTKPQLVLVKNGSDGA